MQIEVLKSKLHCVTVTEANLNYMGSITIDEDLMDAANLIAGEKVQIVDNNNGERLETYIIKGERGSGCICLNGAAARKREIRFNPTRPASRFVFPNTPCIAFYFSQHALKGQKLLAQGNTLS